LTKGWYDVILYLYLPEVCGSVETWQTRKRKKTKTIRLTNEFQRKGEEKEEDGGVGMG
jgi:hypothetical protein